jgi:hypothetical protein
MSRCVVCGGWLWPWQRQGWFKRLDGQTVRWHGQHPPESL